MRRWHPTAALAALAGIAALIAPPLQARVNPAPDPITPLLPDATPVPVTPLVQVTQSSALTLSAGLDHPAVLEQTTEERLLVITVGADEIEGGDRAPLNVAVVMDRSGSMRHQGKIENARSAASELVRALEEEDRFSLVTFSAQAHLLVPSSPLSDRGYLLDEIARIYPSGSTNLEAGLALGLDQVRMNAGGESVDRVIVISDGKPTAGTVVPDVLTRQAAQWSEDGVGVSTIGLGLEYNEDLLAAMADAGGGTYRFVDSSSDLEVAFREELHRLNSVAATGVGLDIAFDDAQLIDVIGYDAELTDTGARVYLGDVYSGETRRVVVRVRMTGTSEGDSMTAATVRLSEGMSQVGDSLAVNAVVTDRPEVVEQTVNRDLAIVGNVAATADLAQAAAYAFDGGDVAKANDLLNESELVAGVAASRYESDALQKQASGMRSQNDTYQNVEPSSDEGRRALKEFKEDNRESYR